MTFWPCAPLHKVTWNCDWCLSIRLVCFVCRTMDMKTYTLTLKAEIQQSIHSVDIITVFLLCFCSHRSYLRSKIEGKRQLSREHLLTYVTLGQPSSNTDEKVPYEQISLRHDIFRSVKAADFQNMTGATDEFVGLPIKRVIERKPHDSIYPPSCTAVEVCLFV